MCHWMDIMFKLACKVSDVKELKYLNDEWEYSVDP